MVVKDIVKQRKVGRGVGGKEVSGLLAWLFVGCLFLCVCFGVVFVMLGEILGVLGVFVRGFGFRVM